MTTAMTTALRIPRFRASASSVCGSEYRCDGIEVGDRCGILASPAGVVTLCDPCCDRTEAASELDALDPTARDDDEHPPAPTNVAEALEALRTEHEVHGQYTDESGALLIALVDQAAEQVAAYERDRWVRRLRAAAKRSTALNTGPGLRMAASLIDRNREQ